MSKDLERIIEEYIKKWVLMPDNPANRKLFPEDHWYGDDPLRVVVSHVGIHQLRKLAIEASRPLKEIDEDEVYEILNREVSAESTKDELMVIAKAICKTFGYKSVILPENCECKGEVLFSGGYGEPKVCIECRKVIDDCQSTIEGGL